MAVATSSQQHVDDTATGVATVASLARDWAGRTPHHVAMREKDFGIWQEYTWDQTWNLVLDAAHGLLALGVEVGDRVSIHAEDRPEWVILDLATVAVRGITVGLYPTNPAAEVEYLLTDSGAERAPRRGPGAGRQGARRRAVARRRCARSSTSSPAACGDYDDSRLMSWDEFLELGAEHRAEHPGAVERADGRGAEPTT